jgi:hypothetical protein
MPIFCGIWCIHEFCLFLLGRCSFEGNSLNIDVRNVIWLATSNIGHELIPQFCEERSVKDRVISREEYVDLMKQLRPVVSDLVGVRHHAPPRRAPFDYSHVLFCVGLTRLSTYGNPAFRSVQA